MQIWIYGTALFFVLWLIVEECIYYFWNRFVYGPKEKRQKKWKMRVFGWLIYLKVLFYQEEYVFSKTHGDKSSSF